MKSLINTKICRTFARVPYLGNDEAHEFQTLMEHDDPHHRQAASAVTSMVNVIRSRGLARLGPLYLHNGKAYGLQLCTQVLHEHLYQ